MDLKHFGIKLFIYFVQNKGFIHEFAFLVNGTQCHSGGVFFLIFFPVSGNSMLCSSTLHLVSVPVSSPAPLHSITPWLFGLGTVTAHLWKMHRDI